MRFKIQDSRFKKGGFTIVETLVAITILMIAIAGPLTVANQALHAALDARNQMIAVNLAQESIEELRNYKDINVSPTKPLSQVFANDLDSANSYLVEVDPGGSYILRSCSEINNSSCSLFLNPRIGYTYSSANATPTPFKRSFTLRQLSSTEYLAVVFVTWTTNGTPNGIQVSDLLSASTR